MINSEEKTRILFVTQELDPYVNLSELSDYISSIPKHLHNKGLEIRVLMPKFGNINERRHRLHEVVRLSGINIIMDDEDYPLIIKVASLPNTRLQVYFLDNEDFFKRKAIFTDENENFYEDNGDRMVFYCKGVLETVKKFGWAPDLIHCHGWMTSLLPFYLKTAYKDEPVFQKAKVIYSMCDDQCNDKLTDRIPALAVINGQEDINAFELFEEPNIDQLDMNGLVYADALIKIKGQKDEQINSRLNGEKSNKPVLELSGDNDDLELYENFYQQLLEN